MCQNPAPAMMAAAASAGLVGLLHKLLNCQRAKPVFIGESVRKFTGALQDIPTITSLLSGAQKCAFACGHNTAWLPLAWSAAL